MLINPWVFYFIEVLENFKNIFLSFIIFGFLIFVIYFVIICFDWDYMGNGQKKTHEKIIKWFIISCLIFAILFVLIPSKETMYTMIVAKNLTTENIELSINAIKECVDYIVEIMK